MAYAYGDKRTGFNGILLWLQGHSDTAIRYVNGDGNQILNQTYSLMAQFLQSKGIRIDSKDLRLRERKLKASTEYIQRQWNEFTQFISEHSKN